MHIITSKSIENFREYLYENEKSEATIEKYTAALTALMKYLDGGALSKRALLSYRERLLKTRQARTVNAALSAINAYLKLMDLKDEGVKFLKIQHRTFRPEERELTRAEFSRLIAEAKRQTKTRLLLVMETICATGIRVSEVEYITVEGVRRGRIEISLKGKIRTILLCRKLCRKLLRYAAHKKIASGEIFLTRNGTSLSRKQIWSEMKSLCRAAGVEESKVFPHNLRHLFARCFYNECRDVVKLSDILGHTCIETTRIYLVTTGDELYRSLESLRLVS